MTHLKRYGNLFRPPTPCTVQSRKRHTDLLMRTAPLTGGHLPEDMDYFKTETNSEDKLLIVADKLVHRDKNLRFNPDDVNYRTENWVEYVRTKAGRGRQAVKNMVDRERLTRCLQGPEGVESLPRKEMVDRILALVAKMKAEGGHNLTQEDQRVLSQHQSAIDHGNNNADTLNTGTSFLIKQHYGAAVCAATPSWMTPHRSRIKPSHTPRAARRPGS